MFAIVIYYESLKRALEKDKEKKVSPLCAQRERDQKKRKKESKRAKEKKLPLCRLAGAIRMPFDELSECVVSMSS